MDEIAREVLEQYIMSTEFDIVYDLYDDGGASADVIQDALENLQRLIIHSIIAIKDSREPASG